LVSRGTGETTSRRPTSEYRARRVTQKSPRHAGPETQLRQSSKIIARGTHQKRLTRRVLAGRNPPTRLTLAAPILPRLRAPIWPDRRAIQELNRQGVLDWRGSRGNPARGLHPTIRPNRFAPIWPDRRLGQPSERTTPDDLAKSKRPDEAISSGRPRVKITTGDLASRNNNVKYRRDNPIEPGGSSPANTRRSGQPEAPRSGQIVRWGARTPNRATPHTHAHTRRSGQVEAFRFGHIVGRRSNLVWPDRRAAGEIKSPEHTSREKRRGQPNERTTPEDPTKSRGFDVAGSAGAGRRGEAVGTTERKGYTRRSGQIESPRCGWILSWDNPAREPNPTIWLGRSASTWPDRRVVRE